MMFSFMFICVYCYHEQFPSSNTHLFSSLQKTLSSGVPCMRSDSLTSSELGLSRGHRYCSRRWCTCLVLAVLFVALGAALGIYGACEYLHIGPVHFSIQCDWNEVIEGLHM